MGWEGEGLEEEEEEEEEVRTGHISNDSITQIRNDNHRMDKDGLMMIIVESAGSERNQKPREN